MFCLIWNKFINVGINKIVDKKIVDTYHYLVSVRIRCLGVLMSIFITNTDISAKLWTRMAHVLQLSLKISEVNKEVKIYFVSPL